mgnify:CR=1 FL=1
MDAGLKEGVTDSGLNALASAGCGELLTSLKLAGKLFVCVILVLFIFVCRWIDIVSVFLLWSDS